MKHMFGAVGIAVCSLCTVAAQADTTINILRVETGDPAQKAYLSTIGKDYEASHPGVKVNFEYLANEAYKSKLPTLLQSDAAPTFSIAGAVRRWPIRQRQASSKTYPAC